MESRDHLASPLANVMLELGVEDPDMIAALVQGAANVAERRVRSGLSGRTQHAGVRLRRWGRDSGLGLGRVMRQRHGYRALGLNFSGQRNARHEEAL